MGELKRAAPQRPGCTLVKCSVERRIYRMHAQYDRLMKYA